MTTDAAEEAIHRTARDLAERIRRCALPARREVVVECLCHHAHLMNLTREWRRCAHDIVKIAGRATLRSPWRARRAIPRARRTIRSLRWLLEFTRRQQIISQADYSTLRQRSRELQQHLCAVAARVRRPAPPPRAPAMHHVAAELLSCLAIAGALLLSVALPRPSWAQVPRLIRYQGQAVDSQGVPLEGPYTLTFRLYDAATGGTKVWEEAQPNLVLTQGRFTVLLGERAPLAMDWTKPCWLAVQINTDPELSPRQPVTSVPLALAAENVDGFLCTTGNKVGVGTPTPSATLQIGAVPAGQFTGYHLAIAQNSPVLVRFSTWSDLAGGSSSVGFERARGTTSAPLAINQGDVIGSLDWAGQVTPRTADTMRTASVRAVAESDFSVSNHSSAMTFAVAPPGGVDVVEQMRMDALGRVGIGTTTPARILTIKQDSDTDPIADSWTVYPSDRAHKDLLGTTRAGYLARIRQLGLYEWKRHPLVTDEDAVAAIERSRNPGDKRTAPSRADIDRKKTDLELAKRRLPKFAATRVGMSIDDADAPPEVLTFNEDGTKGGIDLLAYIGYLHAGLKEAAQHLDALESRVNALPVR